MNTTEQTEELRDKVQNLAIALLEEQGKNNIWSHMDIAKALFDSGTYLLFGLTLKATAGEDDVIASLQQIKELMEDTVNDEYKTHVIEAVGGDDDD